MKKIIVIALVTIMAAPAMAQNRHSGGGDGGRYRSEGFYFLLGGTIGPTFSDFFGYINQTYRSANMKKFGSNVSFNLGYISRFRRNFAVDAGFSIYSLSSKKAFADTGNYSPIRINRELDYQAAVFTATLPLYFEFSPTQPVVPYVGVGISIFSMRLDDFYNNDALRDSRVAVGGHFEAGVSFKLTPNIWLDARGRWHGGNGHLKTFENNFQDFSIKQNIAQYGIGVDYFFR
jgi:opacity protein-like surface antigen